MSIQVQVIKKIDQYIVLEWFKESTNEFGIIQIEYDGQGRYIIDAEYLKFETILEILKCANL